MSKDVVMRVRVPHEERCKFREAARRSKIHPSNALKKLVHAYIDVDEEPTTVEVTVSVGRRNRSDRA
ncbi:hypothetical protein [Stenotrophomonas sp. PS02289]|uniref:hypothetical protein n=1 Tax=Stenotrophomonas sp. PS02289 TaxID=2991422 RepID=UPI00249CB2E3|nr:hypothetical protein [Stenotrophomonas sp. PS02289]